MRALALVTLLALSSCFTTVGAAAGAGIGYFAGNPAKGAVVGALIGLRADIELVRDARQLARKFAFWM